MKLIETQILLVRHGETLWNLEGRWQGHRDSPLTDTGVAQAKAIAERLRHERIGAVYTSDLGRCLATANSIAEATGHEVIPDVRLRERNNGIFEGLTREELDRRYPQEYTEYRRAQNGDYRMLGGESRQELLTRSLDVISDLAQRHEGERVLVVSHGGFLAAYLGSVIGVPAGRRFGFRMRNGSLSVVVNREEQWYVATLGDVCHLEALTNAANGANSSVVGRE